MPELIGFGIVTIGFFITLYIYKKNLPFLSLEEELYVDMELERFDNILWRTSPNWRDISLDEIKKEIR